MSSPQRSRFLAVFRLEVLRLARDRRAFFLAVVLPMLLFPVLFLGMDRIGRQSREAVETQPLRIGIALDSLPLGVQEAVLRRLRDPELALELTERPREELEHPEAALKSARADVRDHAFLIADPAPPDRSTTPNLVLAFDGADPIGREAGRRLSTALGALRSKLSLERVTDRLELDPAGAFVPVLRDLASTEDRAGRGIAALLPLILCLVLVSGASYAALGAFCEEREEGTIETLLVQPVPLRELAAGKFAAVLLTGLVAVLGNGASFALCISLGLGAERGLEAGAPLSRLALALALFLPTAVVLSALLCLFAARARSFREGQHYVLPVLLFATVLASASTQESVVTGGILALIPVTGPTLVLRDALRGTLDPMQGFLAVASSLGLALLLFHHLKDTLHPERIFRGNSRADGDPVESRHALRTGFLAVFLVYVVGGGMQAKSLIPGLLATLWILVPGLAFFAARGSARRTGRTITGVLGLGRPRPAHLLAALLLAPALALLSHQLFELQHTLLPLPSGLDGGELLESIGSLSPMGLVFLLAISPGWNEELLFRGAILSGLKRDLSPGRVILWQALLFGAVHASLYRFFPTAVVGAILATLTLRSGRLWPAVLLHASYNALLVLDLQSTLLWHTWTPGIPLALAGIGGILLWRVPALAAEARNEGRREKGVVPAGTTGA